MRYLWIEIYRVMVVIGLTSAPLGTLPIGQLKTKTGTDVLNKSMPRAHDNPRGDQVEAKASAL
jgi:hypothetical protein